MNSFLHISIEDFLKVIDSQTNYLILDVRTPEEYAQGHIPGAVNINFYDSFSERIKNLDLTKKYICLLPEWKQKQVSRRNSCTPLPKQGI